MTDCYFKLLGSGIETSPRFLLEAEAYADFLPHLEDAGQFLFSFIESAKAGIMLELYMQLCKIQIGFAAENPTIVSLFSTIFVSSHIYPENLEETRVITEWDRIIIIIYLTLYWNSNSQTALSQEGANSFTG